MRHGRWPFELERLSGESHALNVQRLELGSRRLWCVKNTLPEDTLVPVVYNDYAERFAGDRTFPILRRQWCMKDTLPKDTLIPVLFYNYAKPSVEIKISASFPPRKKRTLDNYMESVDQGQLVDGNCSPENARLQQLALMFWPTGTLP